LKFLGANDEG
jgi:hypothetical protein